jgi:CubicO group peptidase (beta-lactamase class C family)
MREGVKDVTITDREMGQLGDYMRHIGFSGVVSISVPSDNHALHTIGTDNIGNTQAPFSIHSVGKVFTGLLAALMVKKGIIDESTLDQPVQLDESVKESIRKKSPALADHLEKTSLRKLMLHQSGVEDYLGNYQDAIESALNSGVPVPEIHKPEDLLQFAEETIVDVDIEKGKNHYSNLGLLLVGLSIQHLYNEKNKNKEGFQPLSYDQILEENICRPAGMTVSLKKPDNGVFNDEKDPVAAHICATPSGGHWVNAQDMQKFGKWIYDEVKKEGKGENGDNTLFQVMERHGGEFYRGGVVSHFGAIESASAQFATHLNSGVVLTVLSNREKINQEFAARQIYYAIDRNMLTKEIP